jgi:hypothetical protein
MNLLDWLYDWQPAPYDPIICLPMESLYRTALDRVVGVDAAKAVMNEGYEIALCDAPEGPTRK